ncbi:MAG: ABC transporter substrate-binding protein [Gemmatimonadota bacterium]|nr:ABC transporter substrate-binding protein [Gemmatimonadota bacterium]
MNSARPGPRVLHRLLVLLAPWGCTVVGSASGGGALPPDPVLSNERLSRSEETVAVELFEDARRAYALDDFEAARAASEEIVERYPGARVAGRALRLLADVAYAQGSWLEADLHAQRWIRLVPENDPRVPQLRLLQGDARIRQGDVGGALDRLTALAPDVPSAIADSATGLVRAAARDLDSEEIIARQEGLARRHPFAAALLAAQARALYNEGERTAARRSAEAALQAGAVESDARVSRVVLDDGIEASLGITGPVTVLGVLLTRTGPPSLTRFAQLVEEGIRAAAEAIPIASGLEIVVEDDHATPEGAAAGMRALEEAGAVAVVGPLDATELFAAARARTTPLPLVSPTAPEAPRSQNVYTLGGFDPEAARTLALWAADTGLRRTVIVHPRGGEAEAEALAFEEALRNSGGTVLARFFYERGATFFETQMRNVENLRPDAVVLPLPPEDIETVAPQITFFGLDTLDIRVLGTDGWTRPEVLDVVAERHTNGVVAVVPNGSEGSTAGEAALVTAYEALFRRTLRSPVPAVGFDAAALVLNALAGGARTPAALADALESMDLFAGATGELGVAEGRVVREHRVVCIQGGRLLPMDVGEQPVLIDRRPPPDSTGERPPVAIEGTPVMVLCPGVAAPAGFAAPRLR